MKMSKILAVVLALTMCLGMVSAYADSDKAADPKILTLSTHLTTADGTVQMAINLDKILREKSDGALGLDIFPDGQLGGQTENCEGLINGSIDMTIVDTGTLANYEPRIGLLDMPYVFESRDQAIEAASGEVGKTLMGYVDDAIGIRPVSLQAILFRNTFLSDGRFVYEPEDFKGIKVRIPENPSIEACFSALGATPVAIPSGEAYTAVQTGVADGLEGNTVFVEQSKYYEVADACSLTEHVMTFTTLCISDSAYDAFTDEERAIFDEAVDEAMDAFYPAYAELAAECQQSLEDAGVTFKEVDKEAMMAACAPALEEFVADNGLEDVYAAIQELA